MFEKLKQKSLYKPLLILLSVFLFFVFSHTSSAADIKAGEITFSLDTQVKDSSGNYSNGNFIKIVEGQDVSLRAIFKLTGPAEGLNIYSDNTKSDKIIYGDLTAPIVGLSVQILPVSDPSSANSGVQAGASSAAVAAINNIHINVNEEKTFDITIPWNQISSSLKLQDKAFGSNTPNFLVAPVLQLNGSPSFWTSFKAGLAGGIGAAKIIVSNSSVAFTPQKRIYAKIYSSVADASADTTVPKDVPGYGGVSGNLEKPVQGSGIAALINEIIGVLLGFFQELIYQVFFYLIAPLIQAVLSIQVYTDTFAAVIYPGWEVVRNICNIFFVVALIVIALATLFRVDSYQFRSLLVQLILAALLVNFSLVIAQAILGLADTIQAQFLPSNVEVIRSLAKDLMVKTYRDVYFTNAFSEGSFSGIVKPLFFLALAMGSFAVFAAIAVFLVIRIVVLWVLLLISPMAYAVGVLPSTAGYRKQWWDMFLKYAFFTPIMAFFLNLTAVIANTYNTNPILQQINSPELQAELGGSEIATFVFKVASNILLLVFLMAALKVADMAGIYGASAITSVAQKGILAPFAAAGGGLKIAGNYAGRRWNDATAKLKGKEEKIPFWRAAAFATLNPIAFTKGLKKQSEDRTHRAQANAEAVGLEVAEQRFSSTKAIFKGSYKINPHQLQHEKEREDDQAKKLSNLSRTEVARRMHQIYMMGNSAEEMDIKRGGYKLAMSKGYIDDIIGEADKNEEGQKMAKKMIELGHLSVAEGDYTVDATGKIHLTANSHRTRRALQMALFGGSLHQKTVSGFVDHTTGEFYEGAQRNPADVADTQEVETYEIADHAAARLITQEGEEEGKHTGHLEYMTDLEADPKTGHYHSYALRKKYKYVQEVDPSTGVVRNVRKAMWVSDGEKNMAAAEIAKVESRKLAQIAWHSLVSSDGKSFSEDIYRVAAVAMVENPGFMQQRQADFLVNGETQTDQVNNNKNNLRVAFETPSTAPPMDYNLNVANQNFADNLQRMWAINKDAAISLLLRSINKANEKNIDKVKADLGRGSRVVINGVKLS